VRTLFLIPARGGSKGFPGKNLAPLAGIPLVGWVTRLARHAAQVHIGSRIVCSTDDPVIAKVAVAWGAEIPFLRPAELATDSAASRDVVLHALDQLGEDFDAVALLQPTSPLTALDDLLGALETFAATGDPVVSIDKASHPAEWCCHLNQDGRIRRDVSAEEIHQRQMAEPTYCPTGSFYVASPTQVRTTGFWGPQTRGFVVSSAHSVDIDLLQDLETAEALLASRAMRGFTLLGRKVGPGSPCFVIAEAGVNHNGSLETALKLVDAAADAGADAVKFQSFEAEKVVSPAAEKAGYQVAATGSEGSQLEMVKGLELSASDHRRIQAHCSERGIMFLSTPFDEESANLLVGMGVPAFKIGSGDLTDHPLLSHVAGLGLPLIVSTGMASMVEVEDALAVIRAAGPGEVALLHCVSNYPAAPADCNLLAMDSMRKAFGVPVGWSDHTLGIHVSVAAVARGASIIEKHLTLDRGLPGPDHAASAEPDELRTLVTLIREVESSLGTGLKEARSSEGDTAAVARRSVHAARTIPAGRRISAEDLIMLRPGTGIPASHSDRVIGKVATRDIQAGEALSESDWS
jgi:N,N'-diacetyllegionaminate synthase